MSKLAKILVTIGVVFLFLIVYGALVGAMSNAGHTPGILGMIIMIAFIGALWGIWKGGKKSDNNNSILQK